MIENPRLHWMKDENIRPYVFVRSENRIQQPGSLHALDWFEGKPPVYINPLEMDQVSFGNQILQIEAQAFGPSNMAMPRWVFFDCAVTPGFVAGFAHRTSAMDPKLRKMLNLSDEHEWTPMSLFIIIPTMSLEGEWVAHNLCSINSLLPKENRYYGLGFLSKAFGLWYANVNICCGFTQWGNAAIKLHSYYGPFQILTAYTPLHSYARTLSYRVKVNPKMWPNFFSKDPLENFEDQFQASGQTIDPGQDSSLIDLQRKLEMAKGPFFLNPQEVLTKDLGEALNLYKPKV
ncbi:MAG: hypothetical protein KDD33_07465 [Bdellovibrionales bacterium]|nr:hypothetical protein [Bdellovibrionales bacterium]